MAIANFSDLSTSIADWLDRDDLTSKIPDFIRLAESRFEREVRTIDMITRSTATVSSRFLALPSDYVDMRRIQLNTDPITNLTQVSPEVLAERYRTSGNGKPYFFCVHEEIEFNRTPDQNYTAELIYWKKLPRLSVSNPTSTLLTNHPDLYLTGAMAEAGRYLHDDMLEAKWDGRYQQISSSVNMNFRGGQYSKGPLTTTVDGPTP